MAKIGPKFGGLPWDFQAEYQKSVQSDLIYFKRKCTPKMERISEETAERYFRKHGHILKWPTMRGHHGTCKPKINKSVLLDFSLILPSRYSMPKMKRIRLKQKKFSERCFDKI
jgi:hypothetical protein